MIHIDMGAYMRPEQEPVPVTKAELVEGAYEHAMNDIKIHRSALRACVRALRQVQPDLHGGRKQIVEDIARMVDRVLFHEEPEAARDDTIRRDERQKVLREMAEYHQHHADADIYLGEIARAQCKWHAEEVRRLNDELEGK